MDGIRFFTEKVIGQRKRVSSRDDSVHVLVILNLLNFRIHLPIAPGIWQSIRFARVWPPIRRQTQIIVLVPARRSNGFQRYRQGRLFERRICVASQLIESWIDDLSSCNPALNLLKRGSRKGKNSRLIHIRRGLALLRRAHAEGDEEQDEMWDSNAPYFHATQTGKARASQG